MATIQLYEPDTAYDEVTEEAMPYDAMLGTWYIITSTIPFYKDKKNVTVTYSQSGKHSPSQQMDDLVEYHEPLTASPTSTRKSIRGTDKRDTSALKDGSHWAASGNRWLWRGKGFLAIATSPFRILGFHVAKEGETLSEDNPEWMVVMPKATMFTPTGVNLYSRTKSLPSAKKEELIAAVKQLKDKDVGAVSGNFFDLKHD